jgi:acetoin utilization protein AcuB
MLVASVMTRPVVTTEPLCSVEVAARLMHDGRFRHLPVTSSGHLVGIMSDRDVRGRECCTVGEVMHTQVIVVSPETPIEVAASLMLDNKIGALPVLDNGTNALVGVVSQTDLFAILARVLGGDSPSTRLELRLEDVPYQLAQVATLAHQRRIPITSLVTLPADSPNARYRTVVLRIGTMVARPFAAELQQAGIEVDAAEGLRSDLANASA